MKLEDVLRDVYAERVKQDCKWGPQNHSPANWLMILGEEVGEANKAALEAHFDSLYPDRSILNKLLEYRMELVQVAAVAVAMIESLDRNELAGRIQQEIDKYAGLP